MKKILSMVTALVLAGFGLASAPLANADPAPIPFGYTITRDADPSGEIPYSAGDDASFRAEIVLGPDWTGWPATRPSRMLFTQSTFGFGVGSDPIEGGAQGYWHFYDSDDPYNCEYYSFTVSLSLPSTRSCVDTIELIGEVSIGMDGVATSDGTVTFATDTWRISYSGVAQTAAHNAVSRQYGVIRGTVPAGDSLDLIPVYDSAVSVEIQGCVDESIAGLVDGDIVTLDLDAAVDGAVVGTNVSESDAYVEWRHPVLFDEDGNLIPTPDFPEAEIDFAVSPPEDSFLRVEGEFHNVNGDSLTIDFGATKDGVSVLETCPLAVTAPPTVSSTTTVDTVVDAASSTFALPTGFSTTGRLSDVKFINDGFGGQFAYVDDWNASTTKLFHLGNAGPSNSFGGGSGLTIPLDMGFTGQASRFGSAGSKWVVMDFPSATSIRFRTGSLTTTAVTTKSITFASLSTLCGRGWSGFPERLLPTQTTNALLQVDCSKSSGSVYYTKKVIAKLTFGTSLTAAKVIDIGTGATTATAGTCLGVGVNPGATGTAVALVAISRPLSSTLGDCTSLPIRGNITVTTVKANLATATSTNTANPFLGGSSAKWPQSFTIVPGAVANTWAGTQNDSVCTNDFSSCTDRKTAFTISATGAITELANVAVDTRHTPLSTAGTRTLAGVTSATNWLYSNLHLRSFDSEFFTNATVAATTPSTGVSRDGEQLSLTHFGYFHNWMSNAFTVTSARVPVYFVLGPDNTYSVVRWSMP